MGRCADCKNSYRLHLGQGSFFLFLYFHIILLYYMLILILDVSFSNINSQSRVAFFVSGGLTKLWKGLRRSNYSCKTISETLVGSHNRLPPTNRFFLAAYIFNFFRPRFPYKAKNALQKCIYINFVNFYLFFNRNIILSYRGKIGFMLKF